MSRQRSKFFSASLRAARKFSRIGSAEGFSEELESEGLSFGMPEGSGGVVGVNEAVALGEDGAGVPAVVERVNGTADDALAGLEGIGDGVRVRVEREEVLVVADGAEAGGLAESGGDEVEAVDEDKEVRRPAPGGRRREVSEDQPRRTPPAPLVG